MTKLEELEAAYWAAVDAAVANYAVSAADVRAAQAAQAARAAAWNAYKDELKKTKEQTNAN
jgi:hypothetical protein